MAPSPSNLASMAKIAAHESVYPPAEDSFLLVDALAALWDDELARSRPKLCIELGTGSGYIACSNALLARAHGCGDVTRTRASFALVPGATTTLSVASLASCHQ